MITDDGLSFRQGGHAATWTSPSPVSDSSLLATGKDPSLGGLSSFILLLKWLRPDLLPSQYEEMTDCLASEESLLCGMRERQRMPERGHSGRHNGTPTPHMK